MTAETMSKPISHPKTLAVGTRIAVQFGDDAEIGTILYAGNGRHVVSLGMYGNYIWTMRHLEMRQYIILPPKQKGWIARLWGRIVGGKQF